MGTKTTSDTRYRPKESPLGRILGKELAKRMQSPKLLPYRKVSLGSEQVDVPYVVLQQRDAAPKSLYRSIEKCGVGKRTADNRVLILRGAQGNGLAPKGCVRSSVIGAEGESLTTKYQLET